MQIKGILYKTYTDQAVLLFLLFFTIQITSNLTIDLLKIKNFSRNIEQLRASCGSLNNPNF